jgi:iron complex outermembrane receptor protein
MTLPALLTHGLAYGASDGDEEAPIHGGVETLVVTGEGDLAGEAPTSFVTVIRPEDYEGRVVSLADLLGETVGVRARSFGGLHSFATVSIRGSTAEQVVVFVDGVPLNSPLGGAVNLAEIPLAGVEKIEIHRGFTPSSLGTSSIGGAVNITTRRSSGEPSFGSSLSYGSHETASLAALGEFGSGPLRWSLSAEGHATEGDFQYLDNNGTHVTTVDDGFRTRENNDGWSSALRFRGDGQVAGKTNLSLSGEWLRRRRGVPGIDAFQSENAGLDLQRGLLRAEIGWEKLASDRLDLRTGIDYSHTSESFTDLDGDVATATPQESLTRVSGAGARFRILWTPVPAHRISLLMEPRWGAAEAGNRLSIQAEPLSARRLTYSAVLEDESHLASGRLILSPSLRFDATRTDGRGGTPGATVEPAEDSSSFSGRFGALWALSSHVSLRANAGRFYRVPSLIELYGNEGAILGNPELLPERGINADLGLAIHFRGAGVLDRILGEVALFRTDADDLIQLVSQPNLSVKAFNIGSARITGVETSLSGRLFGRLDASVNYTRQKPVDLSDTFQRGGDLPGRPREEASTSLTLLLGRVSIFHRYSFVGENEIGALGDADDNLPSSRKGLTVLPDRHLHDAGLMVRLGSRTTAILEVVNLFDRHVVDVARYPLPGRMIHVKIAGTL